MSWHNFSDQRISHFKGKSSHNKVYFLSVNVFVFTSLLKTSFAGYKIYAYMYFLFEILFTELSNSGENNSQIMNNPHVLENYGSQTVPTSVFVNLGIGKLQMILSTDRFFTLDVLNQFI